ncbi:hypothetical protein AVEN_139775-1 [Araneus ventricosus]|uniref:Uncharacterized protein n=2 Tax=Araneus ventricosus TaxID=182803 RepID=A0A4Y2T5F6_ARAVE|nr:hypothetical protein AVEN_139775-1 [Araneus ventricosus]
MDPKNAIRDQLVQPGYVEISSLPIEPVLGSCFHITIKENHVPDKCLELRLGAKFGLYGGGVAPNFSLELLQQFLNFASSMGIDMQEDGIITQHARAFALDGFTMAQCLFPFSEIEETLIWNKVLFNSDVKTDAENWLDGPERDVYQIGLNMMVL